MRSNKRLIANILEIAIGIVLTVLGYMGVTPTAAIPGMLLYNQKNKRHTY